MTQSEPEMTSSPEMEIRHRVINADHAGGVDGGVAGGGGGDIDLGFDPGVATARNPLRSTPTRAQDGLEAGSETHQTPSTSSPAAASESATKDAAQTPVLEPEVTPLPPNISFWAFFTGEIKRGYALENEEDKFRQRREQVSRFGSLWPRRRIFRCDYASL